MSEDSEEIGMAEDPRTVRPQIKFKTRPGRPPARKEQVKAAVERPLQRESARPKRLQRSRDSGDKFYVGADTIPMGMSYNWKAITIVGKDNKEHMIRMRRDHWTPVPAGRHPEISGASPEDTGQIVIDGLILMERPDYLTEEAHDERTGVARDTFKEHMQRVGFAGKGEGPRHGVKLKQTYEALNVDD